MPEPNAPAKLLEPNLPPSAYWLVALFTAPDIALLSCVCRNGLVLCPAIPVSKPVAAFCCPAAFVTPDVSAVRFPAATGQGPGSSGNRARLPSSAWSAFRPSPGRTGAFPGRLCHRLR